ncbi:SORL1 [Branchiostoma lanceolatum]|uniref:SORL1 protein n=1 Tax=Branchiostoma lanceolatum TaxID=7740 RepID=A0A8J9W3M6_BRALA|nr:SORL1 [Branchiostoma lanceolatum]
MRWFVVALSVAVLVAHGLEGSPVKKSGGVAGVEKSEKQKKKLLSDVMGQLRVLAPEKKHESRQATLGADCAYECETTFSYYSSCIPENWVCDGMEDCTTGEDESHCGESELIPEFVPYTTYPPPILGGPDTIYPGPDYVPEDCNFYCPNDAYNFCIPEGWHCDGYPDCYDSSDEQHCERDDPPGLPHYPIPPTAHPSDVYYPDNCTFLCDNDMNGFCIPDYWECDGYPDCRDGSDEFNCDGSGGHHTVCDPMDFLGPVTDVPVFVALLGSVSSLPIPELMAMLNGSKHGGGPLPDGSGMHGGFPEPHGFPEHGGFPEPHGFPEHGGFPEPYGFPEHGGFPEPHGFPEHGGFPGIGGFPEPHVDPADPYMLDHGMYGGPYSYIAKKSTQAKKSAIQGAKELKTAAAKKKAELQQLLRKEAPQGQSNGKAVLAHAQKQAKKWFNSKVGSVASKVKTYSHTARDLANLKRKADGAPKI